MQLFWSKPNRDLTLLEPLGFVGAFGLGVARFVPVAKLLPFWGCPIRQMTGWPCPGCGLTRAADCLAHFHLLSALDANPLGALVGLFLAACAVLSFAHLLLRSPVPNVVMEPREAKGVRWALVVALLCNYAWVVARTRLS